MDLIPFTNPVSPGPGTGSSLTTLNSLGTSMRSLTTSQKTTLIASIADEITHTFITIAHHLATGTLHPKHTKPLHALIHTITAQDTQHREKLTRQLARYRRRARQWRDEQAWMRRQFGALVRRSERVQRRWRMRLEVEKSRRSG